MFPTTIWTDIRRAGAQDAAALDAFAREYRPAILAFIGSRGFARPLAEDLCHEVFVRLLRSDLLARADPDRGRFRTLLRTVAHRVVTDHLRKRRETPSDTIERVDDGPDDEAFDRTWALHLVERALSRMRDERSPYFDVLTEHLHGQHPSRNRLWHARQRLARYVRHEIALTCTNPDEVRQELAHLSPYLQSE